jgi:hypothetical protein
VSTQAALLRGAERDLDVADDGRAAEQEWDLGETAEPEEEQTAGQAVPRGDGAGPVHAEGHRDRGESRGEEPRLGGRPPRALDAAGDQEHDDAGDERGVPPGGTSGRIGRGAHAVPSTPAQATLRGITRVGESARGGVPRRRSA